MYISTQKGNITTIFPFKIPQYICATLTTNINIHTQVTIYCATLTANIVARTFRTNFLTFNNTKRKCITTFPYKTPSIYLCNFNYKYRYSYLMLTTYCATLTANIVFLASLLVSNFIKTPFFSDVNKKLNFF